MKYIWLVFLLVIPSSALAEFRVWCESPDGSQQWSPSESGGIKSCGEGIKHLSNVPLECIKNGRFDRVNCRVPDGNERKNALLMEAGEEKRGDSAGNGPDQQRSGLSGAVLTIMEHSKAREDLIEELSID